MYEEFFGFAGSPFRLNPDPKFFFGSRSHNKAMAYLHYGLRQAEGFIVITGEIGAGKSMLIGHLLDQLDRTNVLAANLLTSSLEPDALLSHILSAFRIEPAGAGKSAEIEAFEDFLFDQMNRGRRVLLIVDEAQNLPIRTLEELRVLSNMDYDGTPLFQVFLVGQPEFRATLARANMEQLRQRVIATYHLEPLDAEETRDYILHRLSLVGWANDPAIDTAAFARLHAATEGVPRKINTLCNRVLLYCALEELRTVDAAVVESVLADFSREEFARETVEDGAENASQSSPKSVSDPLAAALAAAAEAEATLKAADEARGEEEAAEKARAEAEAEAKAKEKEKAEAQAKAEAEAAAASARARAAAEAKAKAEEEARVKSEGAKAKAASAAAEKLSSADRMPKAGPKPAKEGDMAKKSKPTTSGAEPPTPDKPAAGPVSVLDRLRAQREAEASAPAKPAAAEQPTPAAWAAVPAPAAVRERAADAPAPATLVDVAQAIAAASAAARGAGNADQAPADDGNSAAAASAEDMGSLAADARGWRQAVVQSINETRDELKSAHTSVARLRRQLTDMNRRREERRAKIAGSLARAESLLADIRNAWR